MADQIAVTVFGLNYAPEPLGIAPYTAGLCRGLVRRGYRVTVVAGMPHYPEWRLPPEYRWKWSSMETMDGVRIKRVRHFVPNRPSNLRRLLMEASFGARGAASHWKHPDVAICVTPALAATAAQCLRRRGCVRHRPALGVWVQDLYSVGLNETQKPGSTAARVATRMESWVMRQADGVVVAHERFRSQLVQNLGVDPTRITMIGNWAHVQSNSRSNRSVSRRHFGWADDEIVVLHAGSMGIKQGLENVVEAARIADRDRLNLRFVLMGDGSQRSALEAMSGHTNRLEFRDPVGQEDFPAALKAADLLLVNEKPGVSEMSIPSKLTSYFQSGVPVLAAVGSDSNAAREVQRSGAGIMVDEKDPAALVQAAVALGKDEPLRNKLGARGIDYAAAELSEQDAIARFDHWIQRMCAVRMGVSV